MNQWERADTREYRVVRNDDAQYSIWPSDRDLPAGWFECGFRGSREDCLGHVEEVWTDMRPASLRRERQTGE